MKKPAGTPGEAKKSGEKSGASGTTAGTKPGASGGGAGEGTGKGKTGTGKDAASQFGWYHQLIDDAFRSRWEQPVGMGQDVVTSVKLRIMKDGRITVREMVKSSGNPQMDESVMRAAERVLEVDPVPKGLGNGEYYELIVAFKIDR